MLERYRTPLRRLGRDIRGVTAIEFALLAAPLFALVIAAIQIAIVLLSESALEVATEKTARTVFTGGAQAAGLTQSQFLAQVCGVLPTILRNCNNLMVDAQVYTTFSSANTSTPTITYNANGTVSNQWQFNLGTANSIVVLRVMYLLPVVSGPSGFSLGNTANGMHLMMATAVIKNEPYQ